MRTRFHGEMAEINITPMIDVLLVLLILFLVIQPALSRGIDLQLPVDDSEMAEGEVNPDQVVLHIMPGPTYSLNEVPVAAEDLAGRLEMFFAERTRRVLFLRGHPGIRYGDLMVAADVARGVGIEVLGLVAATVAEPPGTEF